MDAYAIVTQRLANQKNQVLIEDADECGKVGADQAVTMLKWLEVKEVALKTIDILARYGYPLGEPHEVFNGHEWRRKWYGKKYVKTVMRNGVLWLLNPELEPFVKVDSYHPYIYFGDDGELYMYVGGVGYGVIANGSFESPDELDKVIGALCRLQELAKDANL